MNSRMVHVRIHCSNTEWDKKVARISHIGKVTENTGNEMALRAICTNNKTYENQDYVVLIPDEYTWITEKEYFEECLKGNKL